jgi:hypothetical protein
MDSLGSSILELSMVSLIMILEGIIDPRTGNARSHDLLEILAHPIMGMIFIAEPGALLKNVIADRSTRFVDALGSTTSRNLPKSSST